MKKILSIILAVFVIGCASHNKNIYKFTPNDISISTGGKLETLKIDFAHFKDYILNGKKEEIENLLANKISSISFNIYKVDNNGNFTNEINYKPVLNFKSIFNAIEIKVPKGNYIVEIDVVDNIKRPLYRDFHKITITDNNYALETAPKLNSIYWYTTINFLNVPGNYTKNRDYIFFAEGSLKSEDFSFIMQCRHESKNIFSCAGGIPTTKTSTITFMSIDNDENIHTFEAEFGIEDAIKDGYVEVKKIKLIPNDYYRLLSYLEFI